MRRTPDRGALSNPAGRFARFEREPDTEALAALWREDEATAARQATEIHVDAARTVISRNSSPDLPFRQSVNPYRGCEHGCIYCYARATHSYLGLSPGRDFETQIYYKRDAYERLRAELASPGYTVSPLALGTNTDPYQPIERKLGVTRSLLELMLELEHPVTVVTKGALIVRDLDLLAELARRDLVAVNVSLTTLDDELKRRMEPRTAGPATRLRMIRELASRGIPTGVLAAPIIPGLNDHELERMLELAGENGARSAGYVLLRLPHEVEQLFVEWLGAHYPDRAGHVLSLLKQMRGGRLNDPQFHGRQRGTGPFAALLKSRFERASQRYRLDQTVVLNLKSFQGSADASPQLDLWSR